MMGSGGEGTIHRICIFSHHSPGLLPSEIRGKRWEQADFRRGHWPPCTCKLPSRTEKSGCCHRMGLCMREVSLLWGFLGPLCGMETWMRAQDWV